MKASFAMDVHMGRASKYSPMVGAVRGEWRDFGLLRGVVMYPDGRRTAGEFEPGGLLLRGAMTNPDGQVSQQYNKESGIILFPDGRVLRKRSGIVRAGELREGLRMLADGILYEGEVSDDGQPHGLGILMLPDVGTRYVGEFVNNKMHGQGVLKLTNGTRYEGAFVNGRPHGQGVLVRTDGSRVAVEMSNGVLVGN